MIQPDKVIKNIVWERHDYPFPYVYAQDVFTDDFYKMLEYENQNILKRGLKETPTGGGYFSRSMPGYDCHGLGFSHEETTGSLSIFLSAAWHDIMGSLFRVRGTGHINAGMHHHIVGTDNGFIHNDLNPVWFPVAGKGRIRLPDHQNCSYKNGAGPLQPHEKIEVVRAVVMIYYFNNGPWFEGYGGETGLYDRPYDANLRDQGLNLVDYPAAKIPPYDNSAVFYECTPKSWHSFIHNRYVPRNSVIMWIHRPIEEALEKWEEKDLERWTISNHPNNPQKTKQK